MIYPPVNIQETMENHHVYQVNQLFLWPFSIAFCVFTRGYENPTGPQLDPNSTFGKASKVQHGNLMLAAFKSRILSIWTYSFLAVSYCYYQWIGFVGKNRNRKPLIFPVRSWGFPVKICPYNRYIYIIYYCRFKGWLYFRVLDHSESPDWGKKKSRERLRKSRRKTQAPSSPPHNWVPSVLTGKYHQWLKSLGKNAGVKTWLLSPSWRFPKTQAPPNHLKKGQLMILSDDVFLMI